jgi:hypothetical protein
MDEPTLYQQLHDDSGILDAIQQLSGNEFQVQQQLRKTYAPELVRLALTLTQVRRLARDKFSKADAMWFDRVGYEQATAEIVARHKSKRFTHETWDLCSGIGIDSIAMAHHVPVHAVDNDPLKQQFAQWNAEAYGCKSNIEHITQDLMELNVMQHLVHIDPDRRVTSGQKAIRLENYFPSLVYLQILATEGLGGAIKLSPASNFGGKFNQAEVELISLGGECKEATIWYGTLCQPGMWRATVLPSGQTMVGHPMQYRAERSTLLRYVHDPDPAVVRAGLVDMLGEQEGLSRLDDAEEYLTSDAYTPSEFRQSFEVEQVFPFDERKLKRELQLLNYGHLEIKCRHLHINVDQFRKQLKLKGERGGVLILMKEQGQSRAVLCQRIRPE